MENKKRKECERGGSGSRERERERKRVSDKAQVGERFRKCHGYLENWPALARPGQARPGQPRAGRASPGQADILPYGRQTGLTFNRTARSPSRSQRQCRSRCRRRLRLRHRRQAFGHLTWLWSSQGRTRQGNGKQGQLCRSVSPSVWQVIKKPWQQQEQ